MKKHKCSYQLLNKWGVQLEKKEFVCRAQNTFDALNQVMNQVRQSTAYRPELTLQMNAQICDENCDVTEPGTSWLASLLRQRHLQTQLGRN